MATIKEATQNAIAFAREALGPERTYGIRLEEIESTTDDGSDVWRITLSMISDDQTIAPGVAAVLGGRRQRDYKTFSVRRDSGEVKSMKIRELSNA